MTVDRYYTPPDVAEMVVAATGACSMSACVDSSCGSGNLLRASAAAFPDVHCVGLDRDCRAIRKLRTSQPTWTLVTGDLFHPESWEGSEGLWESADYDYVLINPPFSMGARSNFTGAWRGESFRCSLAMRYVLETLGQFTPLRGGAAVVPESLLHSEVDERARTLLDADYSLTPVTGLANTTFRGARANAVIVSVQTRLVPGPTPTHAEAVRRSPHGAKVCRGGVQMFAAVNDPSGALLIHSTDLRRLAVEGRRCLVRRTTSRASGRVAGHMVLLPRVGLPHRDAIAPVWFRKAVQLSDCVIALAVSNRGSAQELARTLRESYGELCEQYRGTGARYVTVTRLRNFLSYLGQKR